MNYLRAAINEPLCSPVRFRNLIGGLLAVWLLAVAVFAQSPEITALPDEQTLVIDGNAEMQVFSFGKNVILRQSAKEVFVFGGNVIIEGRVEGDVGTIGGTVIQKEAAYIGGDVIVLGGTYHPEAAKPLRTEGRETVIIGVFEEELRGFAQNPAGLLSPALTWGFLAQRALSVLFWFLISFAFITISPGAVSRAVARLQLSTLKLTAIGASGFLAMTIGIVVSVGLLPGYLSGVVGLMMLLMLFLAYVFGRVTLQVITGKLLQKYLLPESKHSETLAILLGVTAWTIILSIPYIWTVALFLLFSASIGLVFTARRKSVWQNA